MSIRACVVAIVVVLTLGLFARPAPAFETSQAFAKGTYVISGEGLYGRQFNLEGKSQESDIEFWGLGLRASASHHHFITLISSTWMVSRLR